jgi:type II secretory ATPase GspE/PulE/Tfp pilus assembly ATPase PilB-like protein
VLEQSFDMVPTDITWYRGTGCATCHHTGYKRRLALTELWTPGPDEILLINQDAPFDVIAAAARKNTYSMATDALAKLREGRTTLDELLRVMPPSAVRELRSMVN